MRSSEASPAQVPARRSGAPEDQYRLSPMQEGLLFETVAAPGTGAYVWQLVCPIADGGAAERFERAWRRVVERHAVLRTAFLWEGLDEPLQVVMPHADLAVEHLDWRDRSDEPDELLDDFLLLDRQREFDLGVPPLARLTFIRTRGDDRRCVVSSHHLLLDGWSASIVFGEVLKLCDAFARGEDLDPPPPPRFGDYVEWARAQDPGPAETFWRERLQGISAPTSLPVRQDAATWRPTTRLENVKVAVSAGTTAQLGALARRSRVTFSTILLSAWALLLSRYCRERTVLFGSVVSGRSADLPGVESMVGLLINTLPARVDVDPAMPLGEWLRRLQAEALRSREFEHSRLIDIQRWSGIARGRPMFESVLAFQNYPVDAASDLIQSRSKQVMSLEQSTTPLTVVGAIKNTLALSVTYDVGAFEAASIRRLTASLVHLLEHMAVGENLPLRDLTLVDDQERQRVIVDFNATDGPVPEDAATELIERQAAGAPTRTALTAGDASLTYCELNQRANQLARYLRRLGTQTETLVGICLPRSPDMVVALLATMKAGGAYVPLDPEYPPERLTFMVTDAGVRVILTMAAIRDRLPAGTAATVVCLDEAGAEIASEPDHDLGVPVPANSLAYVIYTSGSTGRPKGVMIEHAGLRNYLAWAADRYLDTGARCVVHSTLSFDFTLTELLCPLMTGGEVELLGDGNPALGWADLGRGERRVGMVKLTPAHLTLLAADPEDPGRARCPDVLVLGGEALQGSAFGRLRELSPDSETINEWGATEAAVASANFRVKLRDLPPGPVSIGSAMSNTRIYVLDDTLEPVPVGVAGELFIGGIGVARGYASGPALTAERFLPDPFDSGYSRMYRTGDLGRWTSNGTLDFLGRVDDQVKIRGYRVEPGEVEAVLRSLPAVREAAVVVAADAGGAAQLIAHAALGPGVDLTGQELRQELARTLPDYLLPAAIVVQPALPLTPNGKVDRKALAEAPVSSRPAETGGYVAPRTRVERDLAELWARILKVDLVGVQDNYFDLGGDSITGVYIVSQARELGMRLTPRLILELQTVEALAAAVEEAAALATATDAGPAIIADTAVPLTPIQHWWLESEWPDRSRFQLAFTLSLPDQVPAETLRQIVGDLVEHHDALRMTLTRRGDQWHQDYRSPDRARDTVHEHDLSSLPAEEQDRQMAILNHRAQRGMDLEAGPLLVAAIHRLGHRDDRLMLSAHHFVTDGVSWRILLDDLSRALIAARDGGSWRRPGKTASFLEWASLVHRYAASPAAANEVEYWLAALPHAGTRLPTDFNLGRNTMSSLDVLALHLPEAETRKLVQVRGTGSRSRVLETLLAAVGFAVARWSGQPDVSLDLEGHGREELPGVEPLDLTRSVGWFTSMYPVRLDASGPGWPERRDRVRDLLEGIPHGGVGYGVVRYLLPDERLRRRLASRSGPEIGFNYLGQFSESADGGDQPFQVLEGMTSGESDPTIPRGHVLDVVALVRDGRLRVELGFSRNLHRRDTMQTVLDSIHEALREQGEPS